MKTFIETKSVKGLDASCAKAVTYTVPFVAPKR